MATRAATGSSAQAQAPVNARTARNARMRARRNLFAHIILLIAVFIALFPFYWMVITSVKTLNDAIKNPPDFFPLHWHWENYRQALQQAPFGRYLFNTLLIAMITVVFNLLTSVFAAYAFALEDFPGKNVIFAFLLTTLMIPYDVILIPNFILIKNLHLYDTFWAQIIPWAAGVFGIFLLRQFFLSIPKEIFEAAVMDGATSWGLLWRVAIPLARPALVTVALFTFLASWNAFNWPLIVTASNGVRPIQVGLSQFTNEAGSFYHLQMAATTLTVIPIVVLYFFVQRQLIESVASSGVKG